MLTSAEVDPEVLPGEDTVRVTVYFCPTTNLLLSMVTVPEVAPVTSLHASGLVPP
jgi:hypothetical protein